MFALHYTDHASIWQPAPAPVLGPHDVLINVATSGVNRADLLQRAGKYNPPDGASPILGLEVSGTIAAIGPAVTQWAVGDAVCALLAGGGYASHVGVHEDLCLPIPQGMALIDAAALPEATCTVWQNVMELGNLQAGETILVHGGSSGIGHIAIQLAKAIGASVITTAGNNDKIDFCYAMGADCAINYTMVDFVDSLQQFTHHDGVDVVLDMVGGDYVARNMQCLKTNGRHVSIATPQGIEAKISLLLMMQKKLHLTGSTLRNRTLAEKTELVRAVRTHIWPLLENGTIKPAISQKLPIADAEKAHSALKNGENMGKIILLTP